MTRHDPSLVTLLNRWAAPSTALTVLLGGVVWLTSLYNLTLDNKAKVETMSLDYASSNQRLRSIEDRLARIETKLDVLVKTEFRHPGQGENHRETPALAKAGAGAGAAVYAE